MAEIEWSPRITDERGKIYKDNRDYFRGPFFDDKGKYAIGCSVLLIHTSVGNFLYNDLIPTRKLEDTVPSLETEDRGAFLSFIRQMLAWLPEELKTARELMEHPFLND